MSRSALPVLWLAGAPCAGKSATAWELYTARIAAGRRVAYVDIDQLGMVYPAPNGDPQRNRVKGRAVGRVLRNFAAAGAESAIVSGVVDPDDVAGYRHACHGSGLTFVRLALDRPTLVRRLRARYGDDDVAAALALDARLAGADLDGVVDTTGRSPSEVAVRVAELGPADRTDAVAPGGPLPGYSAAGTAVWVHGAPAVGKSSVAWTLFRQLSDEGGAGYLDVAQLSFLSGVASDDRALAVPAANLAAVWDAFSPAGARWLVLSGGLARTGDLHAGQRHLRNVEFRPVGLTATDEELRARVFLRGEGSGPHLAGDLLAGQAPAALEAAARAAQEVAHRSAASHLPGPTIDTTGRSVETTVALVRDALGI